MDPKMFPRLARRVAALMQKEAVGNRPFPEADIAGSTERLFKLMKLASMASRLESAGAQKKADLAFRSMESTIGTLKTALEAGRVVVAHNRTTLATSQTKVDVQANLLRSFAMLHADGLVFDWMAADPKTKTEAHLELVVPPFVVTDKARMIRVPYPTVRIRWFPGDPPSRALRFYFEDNIAWLHGYRGQFHAHVYGKTYDVPNGFCSGQAQAWIGGSMPEGRFHDVMVSVLDALRDPKITASHDLIHDPRLEAYCDKCQAWSKNIVFKENESCEKCPTCCFARGNGGIVVKADCFEYAGKWYSKRDAHEEAGMPTCPKSTLLKIGNRFFHPLKIKVCCITGDKIGLIARGSKPKHHLEGIQLPDGRFVSVGCLDIIEAEISAQLKEKDHGGQAIQPQEAVLGGSGHEDWPLGEGQWSRFVKYGPGAWGQGIGHYGDLARQNTGKRRKPKVRNRPAAPRAAAAKGTPNLKPKRTRAGKIQAQAGVA